MIVSTGLEKYVDKLVIDSKREITPFKQINGKTLSFPDHYSLLLTFKELPVGSESVSLGKKFSMWNTNKKDGWENYFKLTDTNERFDEMVQYNSNDPNFTMAIEKESDKIKYKVFNKVKIKRKKRNLKLENLMNEKREIVERFNNNPKEATQEVKHIDKEVATELKAHRNRKSRKNLKKFNDLKQRKGIAAVAATIKDNIVGKRRNQMTLVQ